MGHGSRVTDHGSRVTDIHEVELVLVLVLRGSTSAFCFFAWTGNHEIWHGTAYTPHRQKR